jgi:hypothetical protein
MEDMSLGNSVEKHCDKTALPLWPERKCAIKTLVFYLKGIAFTSLIAFFGSAFWSVIDRLLPSVKG